MNVAYILSQYPARSETFIAREMQELASFDNDLTIARMRWSDTGDGLQVENADVLRLHWHPIDWSLGMAWGLYRHPRALLRMGRELFYASLFSKLWWRLLILCLITLALARTLCDRPTEHLRAHFLDSESIAAYWLSRLLDVPFSITLHTTYTRFPTPLAKRVVRYACFCAATSVETKKFATQLDKDGEVTLIRNGIHIPSSRSSPVSLSDTRCDLVAVGRLVEKKGFDTLLHACHLLQAWLRPLRCDIIGDGPLLETLKKNAYELNIDSYVHFRGAQPNSHVIRTLRSKDVLVMPSRPAKNGDRDGIPTVLIEAMAHGTLVVASNFAGIPDLVDHGRTGVLVPPNDPFALAYRLNELFHRPKWRDSMRKRAHKHVRKHYSIEREVRTLNHLIRDGSKSIKERC